MLQKHIIKTLDGFPIHALIGKPEKPIGTIVISSGAFIKKEFYIDFAEYLYKNGYDVALFDYRGIGESITEDIWENPIYLHEWGTLDMNAIVDYMMQTTTNKNIIWIGHGLGAQLVGFIKNHYAIKKVIAINSAYGFWKFFSYPQKAITWLQCCLTNPLLIKLFRNDTIKILPNVSNLPDSALIQWRTWSLNEYYFADSNKDILENENFTHFRSPITSFYFSDDTMANDLTVQLMTKFFPNTNYKIRKIDSATFSESKIGNKNLFKKSNKLLLWPIILEEIEL